MRTEQFEEVINNRIETCKSVLCSKAEEYATDDRLHNFKIAGELQKCTPVKALGGMMAKHTVSVYDLIEDYEQVKTISQEMWAEKIGDSINYLLLLTALLEEDKNGFITLNAEKFSPVTQETIDREIKNFEPMKKAIEKLYEYEQKDIPMKIIIDEKSGLSHCPNCGDSKYILFGDKLCVECGQALDWSDVK